MLTRAIVVDSLRAASRLDQIASGLVAHRAMDATGEVAFIEPGLGQQAPHCRSMNAIAAMRGAGDGKFLVGKFERIGGAALDQRNGLQGFDGGAREYRASDLAERQHATALR